MKNKKKNKTIKFNNKIIFNKNKIMMEKIILSKKNNNNYNNLKIHSKTEIKMKMT